MSARKCGEASVTKSIESEVTIVVQVNGKLRARLVRASGAEEASVRAAALDQQSVRQQIGGKEILNVIYIPDKLINIVVK